MQKAQNFPACGGPTRNNDKRLSIRFIKVDFGRRRRPKIFGVHLGLEFFPPLVRYISRTRGGKNSTIWVDAIIATRVKYYFGATFAGFSDLAPGGPAL